MRFILTACPIKYIIAKTIFKYPVPEERGRHSIDMPGGSRILSLAEQRGWMMLWVECDPSAPVEPREFYVEFTGMNMPVDVETHGRFIGTVLLQDGHLVCHVYEMGS